MADINVERKGPSIWPWVIGLLVLALLIWAIAEMVDTDEEVAIEEEPVEEVAEPPAAVPEPEPVEPGMEEVVELEALMPLQEDDVGRTVRVRGEIVGEPTGSGFWVLTETPENHVIWMQAPTLMEDGEPVDMMEIQTGEAVIVPGMVRRLPEGEAPGLIETAGLRDEADFEQWTVDQEFMVTHQRELGPAQPMPEDTVDGRY